MQDTTNNNAIPKISPWLFFISKNYNIFFSAYTPQFTKIPFAKGRDQLYRILETLALIKPNFSKNFSFLLDELSESQITGYVIAILLNVNQGKNKISAKINLPGTLLHTINIREHSVFNYFKIHQTAWTFIKPLHFLLI